jgi:hypothetical protein
MKPYEVSEFTLVLHLIASLFFFLVTLNDLKYSNELGDRHFWQADYSAVEQSTSSSNEVAVVGNET